MPITPNFFPDSTSFLSCNLISCYQMHSPCMSFWCIKMNKIKTDSPTFFLLMNPLYLRISLFLSEYPDWIFLSLSSLTSLKKHIPSFLYFCQTSASHIFPSPHSVTTLLPDIHHILPAEPLPLVVPWFNLTHEATLTSLKHSSGYITPLTRLKWKVEPLKPSTIWS